LCLLADLFWGLRSSPLYSKYGCNLAPAQSNQLVRTGPCARGDFHTAMLIIMTTSGRGKSRGSPTHGTENFSATTSTRKRGTPSALAGAGGFPQVSFTHLTTFRGTRRLLEVFRRCQRTYQDLCCSADTIMPEALAGQCVRGLRTELCTSSLSEAICR